MWKVLTGILLATAVITGSVVLYPMRHRLFRPDVARVGGTRLVFDVTGDADAVAALLRRRFDPREAEGIVITAGKGRVEVDVPNGRNHDANLDRAKRLAGRPGRLHSSMLAHDGDDAAAVAAAKAWLAAAANVKALKDAHTKGQPFPPFEGDFKPKGPPAPPARYRWAALDWNRAAFTHGMFGTHAASAGDYLAVAHATPAPSGPTTIVFTLLRISAEGEGVTNADVARPRVRYLARGMYGTRLHFQLEADGGRRLRDLAFRQSSPPGPKPRLMALAVDDEVLHHFDPSRTQMDLPFEPVVDTPEEGENYLALIRAPLPAGVRVTLADERALAGK